MLAEASRWWLIPLFIVAFAVGWKLIGWLYDRFAPGSTKLPQPGQNPELPKPPTSDKAEQ